MEDYKKYRGKCKEYVHMALLSDSTLTAVRGHYECPLWGLQAHWWCVRQDGTIYDPTKDQFPSKGLGEYIPFDGWCECSECHKKVLEKDVHSFESNYCFCSMKCHMAFVGL